MNSIECYHIDNKNSVINHFNDYIRSDNMTTTDERVCNDEVKMKPENVKRTNTDAKLSAKNEINEQDVTKDVCIANSFLKNGNAGSDLFFLRKDDGIDSDMENSDDYDGVESGERCINSIFSNNASETTDFEMKNESRVRDIRRRACNNRSFLIIQCNGHKKGLNERTYSKRKWKVENEMSNFSMILPTNNTTIECICVPNNQSDEDNSNRTINMKMALHNGNNDILNKCNKKTNFVNRFFSNRISKTNLTISKKSLPSFRKHLSASSSSLLLFASSSSLSENDDERTREILTTNAKTKSKSATDISSTNPLDGDQLKKMMKANFTKQNISTSISSLDETTRTDCTNDYNNDQYQISERTKALSSDEIEKEKIIDAEKDDNYNAKCKKKHGNSVVYEQQQQQQKQQQQNTYQEERQQKHYLKQLDGHEQTREQQKFKTSTTVTTIMKTRCTEFNTNAAPNLIPNDCELNSRFEIGRKILKPQQCKPHDVNQRKNLAYINSSWHNNRHRSNKKQASCEFVVPPVFPKNRSLYDECLKGGFYKNSTHDNLLMKAIHEARQKWCNAEWVSEDSGASFSMTNTNLSSTTELNSENLNSQKDLIQKLVQNSSETIKHKKWNATKSETDCESDSGRSSLVGSSIRLDDTECVLISKNSLTIDEENATCSLSEKMCNGKFYSTEMNRVEDSFDFEDETILKENELLNGTITETSEITALNETANLSSLKQQKKKDLKSNLSTTLKNRLRTKSTFLRQRSTSTVNNRTKSKRFTVSPTEAPQGNFSTGRYLKQKNSQPQDNSSKADAENTRRSATCHANSTLATQFRRLIRTLSGGVVTQKKREAIGGVAGGASWHRLEPRMGSGDGTRVVSPPFFRRFFRTIRDAAS